MNGQKKVSFENLSSENFANLPDALVSRLEKEVKPVWQKQMNGVVDMEEIDDFAVKVKNLGVDYNNNKVRSYASIIHPDDQKNWTIS